MIQTLNRDPISIEFYANNIRQPMYFLDTNVLLQLPINIDYQIKISNISAFDIEVLVAIDWILTSHHKIADQDKINQGTYRGISIPSLQSRLVNEWTLSENKSEPFHTNEKNNSIYTHSLGLEGTGVISFIVFYKHEEQTVSLLPLIKSSPQKPQQINSKPSILADFERSEIMTPKIYTVNYRSMSQIQKLNVYTKFHGAFYRKK